MDSFPDELLVKIFTYLDIQRIHNVIAKVSTRWKRLTVDRHLNRHVTVHFNSDFDFLERLPTNDLVSSIAIDVQMDVNNTTNTIRQMKLFCEHFPNLTELCIKNRLNDDTIASISSCCPKLRCLDIVPQNGYSENYLNAIRLLEIVVMNLHTDSTTLRWITDNCVNMKEVHFYGFKDTTTSASINDLLRAKRAGLTKLTMFNPPYDTYETISQCSNLKELRLYECWHLFRRALMSLANLRRLTVLHMTGTKAINECHLNEFICALDVSHLMDLYMRDTPFCDLNALLLAYKEPPLWQLDLANCENLTREGVLYLVRKFVSRYDMKLIIDKRASRQIIIV